MASFKQLIEQRWNERRFLCVGLDPDMEKIRLCVHRPSTLDTLTQFCDEIVNATAEYACAYKPNFAFFEALGKTGIEALYFIIEHIRRNHPDIPVILDRKAADIGNSNLGTLAMTKSLGAHAITLNPYLGRAALRPFLDNKNLGCIILCRTSNEGAEEFQDIDVGGMPLYQHMASQIACEWNTNGNCALVVGATAPAELANVRKRVGTMPILIPGIGAQGGDLEATVKAGASPHGRGIIVNASRSILYASNDTDFAEAAGREAKKLHDDINLHRKGL